MSVFVLFFRCLVEELGMSDVRGLGSAVDTGPGGGIPGLQAMGVDPVKGGRDQDRGIVIGEGYVSAVATPVGTGKDVLCATENVLPTVDGCQERETVRLDVKPMGMVPVELRLRGRVSRQTVGVNPRKGPTETTPGMTRHLLCHLLSLQLSRPRQRRKMKRWCCCCGTSSLSSVWMLSGRVCVIPATGSSLSTG